MKFCNGCQQAKSDDQFITVSRPYGETLYYRCKSCSSALNKIYSKSETGIKRRAVNWSKNKEILSKKYRNYYEKNPEKALDRHLMSKYGITADRYRCLLDLQNGVCKICGNKCSEKRRLSVDHCHTTQQIRGLLCVRCNAGLGNFKDDPKRLKRAIEYLEDWYDIGLDAI